MMENEMQETNKFGLEDVLVEETDTQEALTRAAILPEPEVDGPVELLERGWELMQTARARSMVRSWQELAHQWREDCAAWVEANPTADY